MAPFSSSSPVIRVTKRSNTLSASASAGADTVNPHVLVLVLVLVFTSVVVCAAAGFVFVYRRRRARSQNETPITGDSEIAKKLKEKPKKKPKAGTRTGWVLRLPGVGATSLQPSSSSSSSFYCAAGRMPNFEGTSLEHVQYRTHSLATITEVSDDESKASISDVETTQSPPPAYEAQQTYEEFIQAQSSGTASHMRPNEDPYGSTASLVSVSLESSPLPQVRDDDDAPPRPVYTPLSTPSLSSTNSSPSSISSCWDSELDTPRSSVAHSSPTIGSPDCLSFPTMGSLAERLADDTPPPEPASPFLILRAEDDIAAGGKVAGGGLSRSRSLAVLLGLHCGIRPVSSTLSGLCLSADVVGCESANDEPLPPSFSSADTVVGLTAAAGHEDEVADGSPTDQIDQTGQSDKRYAALIDALAISFSISSLNPPRSSRSSCVLDEGGSDYDYDYDCDECGEDSQDSRGPCSPCEQFVYAV